MVGNELSVSQLLNVIDTIGTCGDRVYELTVSPSLPTDVLYIDGTTGDITLKTSLIANAGSYTGTVRAYLAAYYTDPAIKYYDT